MLKQVVFHTFTTDYLRLFPSTITWCFSMFLICALLLFLLFLLIEYLCLFGYFLNQIIRYLIFVLLIFFHFLLVNTILYLTIVLLVRWFFRAQFFIFKAVFKLFWITFFVNVAKTT
jgi:hypothetical protein